MKEQFDIPVVMIVYKRLELTKRSFEPIRQLQPQKLYIIADGPRDDNEKEKVAAVREYLDTHVDWKCEVHKNYADHNYGLRYRMPSGMQWVFETEDKAIFIEDDIEASQNFFCYCRELLEKYREDERVLMISGSNIYPEHESFGQSDICFSMFASIWGWACWKRSFEKYNVNIRDWPKRRKKRELKAVLTENAYFFYKYLFDDLQYHWFRTWDYQWTYLMLTGQGLGIVPKYNLIRNIGMGDADAEHKDDTKERIKYISEVEKREIELPISCFPNVERNKGYDKYFQDQTFRETISLLKKIKYEIRGYLYERFYRGIKQMEKDVDYMTEKLPEKYRLTEEEQRYNQEDKYRLISPKEMRHTLKEYKKYKKK